MKIIVCRIFKMITVMAIFTVIMASCDDMNSLHEKYLDRGIGIYIGSADSLSVQSGLHRIGFRWKINADPRIDKTIISWEEIEDGAMVERSVELPLTRTDEGEMWLEHIITDLAEGEYIFKFQMLDNLGNTSNISEISGLVLGDAYVENLRNRNIKSLSKLETGDMQISWEAAPSGEGLLYSVVEYVNKNGETTKVEVPNDEDNTLLTGLETGDEVEIYAVYLPENGLENFQSIPRLFTMPRFERLLDKSRFVAAFKPGDNTTPHPGGGANDWMKPISEADLSPGNRGLDKLWDGGAANASNNRTILHTADQSGDANAPFKFPHHFTFDLGTDASLSTFKIWARADNPAFTGHSPRFFEIWATDVPKELEDFPDQAAFEQYYRTTYVDQKNPLDYLSSGDASYMDKLTQADARSLNFVAPAPQPGIYNWQQDWVKLGDFEIEKPSGQNYNSSNDADKALWGSGSTNSPEALESTGFSFSLPESTQRYRYIRLVVKYPNWQNTNCINIGEISIYGDDI